MGVRRIIRVVHRDVGYLCAGLVIFYAISGIAVNHIDEWNPSYATSRRAVALGPLAGATLDALEKEVVSGAGLDADDVAGRYRPDRQTFVVFLPHGGEARVDVETGEGTVKEIETRAFLFESNVLHLNHLKGAWTYVADAFGVLLLALALTGLFMLRGRTGLKGRGKWFFSAGLAVPVGFLVYYTMTR